MGGQLSTGDSCEICAGAARMNAQNPYWVAELETGNVVLGWNQMISGYTLFLSKVHVAELHDLPPAARTRFLEEMAVVAQAVWRAFSPRKLNYEMLGNSVAHAHWHIFPRYDDDPNPAWPVWNNEAWVKAPRVTEIDGSVLAERRERLRAALAAISS
jgi:diadenosine tetraphosphate (Ap4A) HIT family hydrolase